MFFLCGVGEAKQLHLSKRKNCLPCTKQTVNSRNIGSKTISHSKQRNIYMTVKIITFQMFFLCFFKSLAALGRPNSCIYRKEKTVCRAQNKQ